MDRKQLIADLKGRANHLLFSESRTRVVDFLTAAENSPEEKRKELLQLKRDSLKSDAKLAEYNKIRALVIDNFVLASSNAASFFRTVSLDQDEEPVLENTTGMLAKARVIGEDGKPHMTQATQKRSRFRIPLDWVSTDILEYILIDIYKGRIGQDILNAVPLSRELGFAIDKKLWKLVTALPLATFDLTNSKTERRTFVLHPNIIAANVPAGNLIDMSAEGKFNFNVIKGIVKWFMQMANIFPDGPTAPEVIFVPSLDVTAFIDQISLDSRGDNPGVQQIFTDGWITKLGGKSIAIVGDATLDPAAGIAYVRTNKPIGEHYTKPSLDVNYPESTDQIPPKWIQENKGETFMKKVFGAITPLPWTINMLAVKYKVAS